MYQGGEYGSYKLPDITIYGGDTTPWSIVIVKQSGIPYPYDMLSGSTARLTLTPYALSIGLGADAEAIAPVLTKTGTVTRDPRGAGTVLFTMAKGDTLNLRGKYIYQIEIAKGDELRVLQGVATIRQNINRT